MKIKNRRRGPDFISRSISLVISASWVLLIALFIIISIAKPRSNFISSAITGVASNQSMWDVSIIHLIFPVLLIQLLLCLFGLALSTKRMKRKGDTYSKSLIFFAVVAVLGIIGYFVAVP